MGSFDSRLFFISNSSTNTGLIINIKNSLFGMNCRCWLTETSPWALKWNLMELYYQVKISWFIFFENVQRCSIGWRKFPASIHKKPFRPVLLLYTLWCLCSNRLGGTSLYRTEERIFMVSNILRMQKCSWWQKKDETVNLVEASKVSSIVFWLINPSKNTYASYRYYNVIK